MVTAGDVPKRGDPSPFSLEGGPVGILMVHGFTGSPGEVRPTAEELHRRGLTVHAPLLPGHGTTPQDLNTRRWQEWADAVAEAYARLRARCEVAFLGGLSLGSLLSLYYAARHPELPGVIACSPAIGFNDARQRLLPLARFFVKTIPTSEYQGSEEQPASWFCYGVYPIPAAYQLTKLIEKVKQEMAQISSPILIVYSTDDRAIRQDGPQRLYDAVASSDREMLTLNSGGHVITAGASAPTVAATMYNFMAARAA